MWLASGIGGYGTIQREIVQVVVPAREDMRVSREGFWHNSRIELINGTVVRSGDISGNAFSPQCSLAEAVLAAVAESSNGDAT